jgi:hypothetical protein
VEGHVFIQAFTHFHPAIQYARGLASVSASIPAAWRGHSARVWNQTQALSALGVRPESQPRLLS